MRSLPAGMLPPSRRSARTIGPLLALAVVVVLAGCGAGADSSGAAPQPPSGSAASTDTLRPQTTEGAGRDDAPDEGASDVIVNVAVRGEQVEPVARRVRAHTGQRIVFQVDADRAGALHVHSSPEQTVPFSRGRNILSIRIKVPGVVDVEEHESDALVARLEVR